MALKRAGAFLLPAIALLAQKPSTDTGQQLYQTHCFVCHGDDGQQVPGVNFRAGVRRASSDEELSRLILNGIPGTGMPATNLTEPQRKMLAAYLRSLSSTAGTKGNGDVALGRTIFEGKGGCTACHRVGAKGSRLGPDLSEIGALRQAEYLERSLLDPNETIAPQNRFVRVVLRDGTTVTGRRLNEDTHSVQLIDDKERLLSISKAEVREYSLLKTSAMPSYQGKLSTEEIAGLVSYLASLKGSQ